MKNLTLILVLTLILGTALSLEEIQDADGHDTDSKDVKLSVYDEAIAYPFDVDPDDLNHVEISPEEEAIAYPYPTDDSDGGYYYSRLSSDTDDDDPYYHHEDHKEHFRTQEERAEEERLAKEEAARQERKKRDEMLVKKFEKLLVGVKKRDILYMARMLDDLGHVSDEYLKKFGTIDHEMGGRKPTTLDVLLSIVMMWESYTKFVVNLSKIKGMITEHKVPFDRIKVYTFKPDRIIFIIFRGTVQQNATDIMFNIAADLKPCLMGSQCKGKVHQGYQAYIRHAAPILYGTISEYIKKGYRIMLGGHSMGAGFATLAGLFLKNSKGIDPLGVVAIGSPRIGDKEFAAYVQSTIPTYLRYVLEYRSRDCGIMDTNDDNEEEKDEMPDENSVAMESRLLSMSKLALYKARRLMKLVKDSQKAKNEIADSDMDKDQFGYGFLLPKMIASCGNAINRARRNFKALKKGTVGNYLKKRASKIIKKASGVFSVAVHELQRDGSTPSSIGRAVLKKISHSVFESKKAKDIVTRVPPSIAGYHHIGDPIVIPCPFSCNKPCCSLTHIGGMVECHGIAYYTESFFNSVFTKKLWPIKGESFKDYKFRKGYIKENKRDDRESLDEFA